MNQEPQIVIVEDDDDDALLIRRALTKAGLSRPPHVLFAGEQLIAYLNGQGPFANSVRYPLPHLILLDLKLPGMDGFEALRRVRACSRFDALRIVVLTGSIEFEDAIRAYELGANSFVRKPLELEDAAALLEPVQSQQIISSHQAEAPAGLS